MKIEETFDFKLNSLKIKTDNKHLTSKVIINDIDVSNKISGIALNIKAGKVPTAVIEVPFDDIELEGDFEVLRALPKEENNIRVSINAPENVNVDGVAEKVAKKIAEDFNKSSYR